MRANPLSRLAVLAYLLIATSLVTTSVVADDNSAGLELFEKKIRPVLIAQCYECHSAKSKEVKGDLLLDTREGVLAGGSLGPAVVPGKPAQSLLLKAIGHTDPDLMMPPKSKLPAGVVADFEQWIKLGAPDPRDGGVAKPSYKPIDLVAGKEFWSFQPLATVSPPKVRDNAWPRGDVDRFVLSKLEAAELTPVADADRATLARRLYFDLTGLPPSPEELLAFVNDRSPRAVEDLVDRLLASPQFGERWGRHWLDVARYAESNGNVDNLLFPHAWRYRDYVIDAMQRDTPFDRFVSEQVAGDLLPAADWRERERNLVATGFLALTSKPRPQNNPDYAMDLVADQIEVTTTAVLGLTVACARCHDHKFDPVPQREYYALAGIFTSTEMLAAAKGDGAKKKGAQRYAGGGGLHEIAGDPEKGEKLAAHRQAVERVEARLATARQDLAKLGGADKPAKANPLADPKLTKAERQAIKKQMKQAEKRALAKPAKAAPSANSPAAEKLRTEIAELEAELSRLAASAPASSGFAMGVRDGQRPGDTQICIRGESQRRGESVPRGFITVASGAAPLAIDAKQSGRLELARWLTDRNNPLTARVYVNRVWSHLFGAGLVRTPDNFGLHGERPTHPELLDWLARWFLDDGQSTKRLIKLLVMSHAYQLGGQHQAAAYERDPDNRLLWRHSARRLDAEEIRDAMLATSGGLDRSVPAGSLVTKFGSTEVRNNLVDQIASLDHRHRSIYLPAVRNATPEVLELFDAADSSLVVGARSVTTVPAQALFLMNSPFVVSQSRGVAKQLLAMPNLDDAGRVRQAFRQLLSREATDTEVNRMLVFLDDSRQAIAPSDDASIDLWAAACQALYTAAEFRYLN